jgi:hypothetical protein
MDSSRRTTEGAASPVPVHGHGHRPAASQNTSTHNPPPRRPAGRPQTFDRQTGDMPDLPVPQISLPHHNSPTAPPRPFVATTAPNAQPDGILTPSTPALPHPPNSTDHPGRERATADPPPSTNPPISGIPARIASTDQPPPPMWQVYSTPPPEPPCHTPTVALPTALPPSRRLSSAGQPMEVFQRITIFDDPDHESESVDVPPSCRPSSVNSPIELFQRTATFHVPGWWRARGRQWYGPSRGGQLSLAGAVEPGQVG